MSITPTGAPEERPSPLRRLSRRLWVPIAAAAVLLAAAVPTYLITFDDSPPEEVEDATPIETPEVAVEEGSDSGGPTTVFEDPAAFEGDQIAFSAKVGKVVDAYSFRLVSPNPKEPTLLVVHEGITPVEKGWFVGITGWIARFTPDGVEEKLSMTPPPATFGLSDDEFAFVAEGVEKTGKPAETGTEVAASGNDDAASGGSTTVASDQVSAVPPTSGSAPAPAPAPAPAGSGSSGSSSGSGGSSGGSGGSGGGSGGGSSSGSGGSQSGKGSTPAASKVTFTEASDSSGQYSDEVTFEARLVDGNGDPIQGVRLRFELGVPGSDSSRTFSSRTDNRGIASESPVLTEAPGIYKLAVRYGPKGDRVFHKTDFEVTEEDTGLTLTVSESEDQGNDDRTLTARLSDADSAAGIAGRTVDFYAEGELIGSASTDDSGIATIELPPRYKNRDVTFEARFASDTFYLPSSATA